MTKGAYLINDYFLFIVHYGNMLRIYENVKKEENNSFYFEKQSSIKKYVWQFFYRVGVQEFETENRVKVRWL